MSPEEANANCEQSFADASLEWRRLFAEFWGTMLLVAAATGADIASDLSHHELTRPVGAVAPGLMVMAAIYFMGEVSGAHLNPAVTFAFALRRNFPWWRTPGYFAAQVCGALAAAYGLHALFGDVAELGATSPHNGVSPAQAVIIESFLTAGLVNTILGTASGARNVGTNAGIAVGGYIALSGLWASSLTGASMNPARSLGPDIVRSEFALTWIYLVGPFAGAAIGVAFEWIIKGPPTSAGTRAAQGEISR
jgi:aquaporin Z